MRGPDFVRRMVTLSLALVIALLFLPFHALAEDDPDTENAPELTTVLEEDASAVPGNLAADIPEGAEPEEEPEPASEEQEAPVEEQEAPATEPSNDAQPSDEPVLEVQAYDSNAKITYKPAQPITFVEGSGVDEYGDGYYCYHYQPQKGDVLVVAMKGGTTHTFTYTTSWKGTDGYSAQIDLLDIYAKLTASQNTIGKHQLTIDYQRYDGEGTGTVDFEIIANPVASITYEPAYNLVLVKGVDSYTEYEYVKASKKWCSYQRYYLNTQDERLMGDRIIVSYVDSDTPDKCYTYRNFAHPTGGYETHGFVNDDNPTDVIEPYEYDFSSDQSYENRWWAGKHHFTLNYLGRTADVPVTCKAQTVTKVEYVHTPAFAYTTAGAIAYTRSMGIYEGSYANRVTRYQIVFKAPTPAAGDVLKVTDDGTTTSYAYDAATDEFVSTVDPADCIPSRQVVIQSLTVKPDVRTAAFPASYEGCSFSVPFKVSKASQTVTASNKEVVLGKKTLLGLRSTGFANTLYKCTSSNPKVATVDQWGLLTAKKVGTVRIKIVAHSNVAYDVSKTKTIKVKVGRINPLRVKAKSRRIVVRARQLKKKRITLASNVKIIKKGRGALRYKNMSTSAKAKKFKVKARTGKVTIPKRTRKGTYVIKVRVTARGDRTYLSRSRIVTYRIVVK